MRHEIHRVTAFRQVDTYSLAVSFDDGSQQEIDFEPVLIGPVFGKLRRPAIFAGVKLDPEAATLVWPNGADFDPATLHDWPQVAEELAERARRWNHPAAP